MKRPASKSGTSRNRDVVSHVHTNGVCDDLTTSPGRGSVRCPPSYNVDVVDSIGASTDVPTIQMNSDPETPLTKSGDSVGRFNSNRTGMPDGLKAGLEQLSGFDMSDVRVHYNSNKPAQLSALAYAQGTDIHLAPGQEDHLPHESWHVVQQMQGRVRETRKVAGNAINDDAGLEREADRMGTTALRKRPISAFEQGLGRMKSKSATIASGVHQTVRKEATMMTQPPQNLVQHRSDCPVIQLGNRKKKQAKRKKQQEKRQKEQQEANATAAETSSPEPDNETVDVRSLEEEKLEFLIKTLRELGADIDNEMAEWLLYENDDAFIILRESDDETFQELKGEAGESKEAEEYREYWIKQLESLLPEDDKEYLLKVRYQKYQDNLPKEGGSGSSSWSLGSVRNGALQIVWKTCKTDREFYFPDGTYTIHHLVSRSHLSNLLGEIESNEAKEFRDILGRIGTDLLNGAQSPKKILNNLPFNLEVGPDAGRRDDDPGSEFDGDVPANARTRQMKKIDDLTLKNPRTANDWQTAKDALKEALTQHQHGKTGWPLRTPFLKQWSRTNNKRFKRDGGP